MADEPDASATPEEDAPITFAEFLERIPPSTPARISNLASMDPKTFQIYLSRPALQLHCPQPSCNGLRMFRAIGAQIPLTDSPANQFLAYVCSNCQRSFKTFALRVHKGEGSVLTGSASKYGEYPSFGPRTPERLLKLIGKDRETFLKGRQCENQGLGIGAFVYYRRVVEGQRNVIFDKIIEVANRGGASPAIVAELDAAKQEQQFGKAVDQIKSALPQALLIDGHHNPLKLLYSALSDGLHLRSDEHCLELATSIRVVLLDLSERIDQILKDEQELKDAVTRLLKARQAVDEPAGDCASND